MGPGILPETTVGKHNPPCHLQMPTKALSCKKEAICEDGPEELSCSVGQGSFKIDCFKVKTCSMVRRFQQDNAKPHTEAITTAWLHSGRVRVLN